MPEPPRPPRLPAPRSLDRATAWGCVISNLLVPGLGTFAAGQRHAGALQLLVSQSGFALTALWGVWLLKECSRTKALPEELGPYSWEALVGMLLFFSAWSWSLVSSVMMLSRSRSQPQGERVEQSDKDH